MCTTPPLVRSLFCSKARVFDPEIGLYWISRVLSRVVSVADGSSGRGALMVRREGTGPAAGAAEGRSHEVVPAAL